MAKKAVKKSTKTATKKVAKKATKKVAKKTATKVAKKATKKVAKTAAKKVAKNKLKVIPEQEEIRLQAYFVYQARIRSGQHGDHQSDWAQAITNLTK